MRCCASAADPPLPAASSLPPATERARRSRRRPPQRRRPARRAGRGRERSTAAWSSRVLTRAFRSLGEHARPLEQRDGRGDRAAAADGLEHVVGGGRAAGVASAGRARDRRPRGRARRGRRRRRSTSRSRSTPSRARQSPQCRGSLSFAPHTASSMSKRAATRWLVAAVLAAHDRDTDAARAQPRHRVEVVEVHRSHLVTGREQQDRAVGDARRRRRGRGGGSTARQTGMPRRCLAAARRWPCLDHATQGVLDAVDVVGVVELEQLGVDDERQHAVAPHRVPSRGRREAGARRRSRSASRPAGGTWRGCDWQSGTPATRAAAAPSPRRPAVATSCTGSGGRATPSAPRRRRVGRRAGRRRRRCPRPCAPGRSAGGGRRGPVRTPSCAARYSSAWRKTSMSGERSLASSAGRTERHLGAPLARPPTAISSSSVLTTTRVTRVERERVADRPRDQRLPGDRQHVLPRDALRATARRDQREDLAARRGSLERQSVSRRAAADAAQLLLHRELAVVDDLDAVAERGLDGADVAAPAAGSPNGSTDAAWSEPHIARSSVMCRSIMHAPRARGRDGRGEADLVARVADRHAVALAQRRDRAQVQLVGLRRVGARRVQEDEVVGAEHLDGVVDLARASLMPVDRMIGRPYCRWWRSRSSSVSDAEAIL